MNEPAAPGSLGMPIEVAKDKLRKDPNTKKIAADLGVDLETYIAQVIHYAQHPQIDAEVSVISDAELAEHGVDVPSVKDVKDWFGAVKDGEVDLRSPGAKVETRGSFSTEQDVSETMRAAVGVDVEKKAPAVDESTGEIFATDGAGSALRDQLLRQRNSQSMNPHRPSLPPKPKK